MITLTDIKQFSLFRDELNSDPETFNLKIMTAHEHSLEEDNERMKKEIESYKHFFFLLHIDPGYPKSELIKRVQAGYKEDAKDYHEIHGTEAEVIIMRQFDEDDEDDEASPES